MRQAGHAQRNSISSEQSGECMISETDARGGSCAAVDFICRSGSEPFSIDAVGRAGRAVAR